jgi:hypothetical protein
MERVPSPREPGPGAAQPTESAKVDTTLPNGADRDG